MREYQRGRSRWRGFGVRLQDVGIVAIRHDVKSSGDISPIPLGELSMQFRGIENNRVGSLNDLRFKPPVSAGAAWSTPWRPRPRISEVRDPVNIADRPQGISNQMAGERRRGRQYQSIRCRRTMRSPRTTACPNQPISSSGKPKRLVVALRRHAFQPSLSACVCRTPFAELSWFRQRMIAATPRHAPVRKIVKRGSALLTSASSS